MSQALESIESILIIAHAKGLSDRDGTFYDIKHPVKLHTDMLDSLGVSWKVQNNALAFINNRAEPYTWQAFYKISKRKLSEMIMSGISHDDIVRNLFT